MPPQMRQATHLLQIYVLPHCIGCDTARHIAERVRNLELSHVDTQLIDLSRPHTARPTNVFAVPTYVLNGAVVSRGNPDIDWLLAQLA